MKICHHFLAQHFVSSCLENTVHIYNKKVEAEGKPVTDQKSSGRCWLFACLNVARQPFIKQFNLEDMEFSQGHLFYWDKIERANYFLHNIGRKIWNFCNALQLKSSTRTHSHVCLWYKEVNYLALEKPTYILS